MNIKLVCSLALLLGIVSVSSQDIDDEFDNSCTGSATCGECIRKSSICSWCKSESFERGKSRCDVKLNLKRNNCSDSDIAHPISRQSISRDDEYTSGDQKNSPIQIKPQEMKFTVRPNDLREFVLSYQQQKNYPVDLYLLFDITSSIVTREDDAKTKLIALGTDLPKGMENITNNFQLGYGSFVDKVVMPYSAWSDQLLIDRCPKGHDCIKPHLFKNEAKLGVDAKSFAESMEKTLKTTSQSMDDTEGGLEALIQVLECNEYIGWRSNSRKIVVYSSNSKFHLAGAGKLGGATKPAEMSCKMKNSDAVYSNLINDYPSVSQISAKLTDTNANIIFAVTGDVQKDYRKLKMFVDQAEVGTLENNSSNIVELIKNQYNTLRSKVVFKPQNDDNVVFKFRSKCLGHVEKETDRCENLKIGNSVDFDVSMTVKPEICKGKTGTVNKMVNISAVGTNEQLTINLEVICECECEKPVHKKINSPQCSDGNGTLECGICSCNDNRYGRTCECDETEMTNMVATAQCIASNESEICSDRGECICGECKCFKIPGNKKGGRYSGNFCQCSNYNCPFDRNKKLCGGQRGRCVCGKCDCNPGWEGLDCSCTTDKSTCMAANNKSCNGVGECNCGKCTCSTKGPKKMTGPTCEDCLTCPKRCSEYVDCAQCIAFGTGKHSNIDTCNDKCKTFTRKDDTLPSGDGHRECTGTDVDGCNFLFTYTYTEDNDVRIVVQGVKECPEEAPVMAIVGGTVAAVVLIPLLLIILFIFIRNRRDAKEFADFMKERDRAKWDSAANPIYKNPNSTFQNPTYKGGK